MSDSHGSYVGRFLAALLVIGGGVGIGIAFWMGYKFVQVHWIYGVLVIAFLALFVGSTLAGVRLWRGEAKGWKWATILFALQIPVLTVPGLSYQFYTGIAVNLLGGDTDNSFALNFGANANLYLDTRITGLIYGINLFAVAAVVYLLCNRPNKGAQPATQSVGADA